MRLSVIVPVYKAEKFLNDCLDSLLDQDFKDNEYEIICVNDGSPDNSLQILKEYAEQHKNIVVYDKENAGVSEARNDGLKLAKGNFIAFCDSDDCYKTNSLSYIVSYMEKNGLQVIAMKNIASVKEDYHYKVETLGNLDIEILKNSEHSAGNAVSLIVDRKIIVDNNINFYTGMKYGEDTLYAGKVYAAGVNCNAGIGVLHTPIYYYRNNSNSAMKNINSEKHLEDMLTMAREYVKLKKTCNGKILNRKIGGAVSAMLFDNIRVHKYAPKELFPMLEKEGLYPYESQWKAVKSSKSIKLLIMNLFKYSFRFKFLYKIYYTLIK